MLGYAEEKGDIEDEVCGIALMLVNVVCVVVRRQAARYGRPTSRNFHCTSISVHCFGTTRIQR